MVSGCSRFGLGGQSTGVVTGNEYLSVGLSVASIGYHGPERANPLLFSITADADHGHFRYASEAGGLAQGFSVAQPEGAD